MRCVLAVETVDVVWRLLRRQEIISDNAQLWKGKGAQFHAALTICETPQFCYGKGITQFHVDENSGVRVAEFLLGKYDPIESSLTINSRYL
jgi:hypothetical protein